LTEGDLGISYTADFSGIALAADWQSLVIQIGLTPFSGLEGSASPWVLLNPARSGWLGNVVANTTPNNINLNLNDKFDLQTKTKVDETYYDVIGEPPAFPQEVPEPANLSSLRCWSCRSWSTEEKI